MAPGEALCGMTFSFTIADPRISGCPLIGCSSGFGTLCSSDIRSRGRNCTIGGPVPTIVVNGVRYTLQGTNISHLGKRKIIFKMPFLMDMLVAWRATLINGRRKLGQLGAQAHLVRSCDPPTEEGGGMGVGVA